MLEAFSQPFHPNFKHHLGGSASKNSTCESSAGSFLTVQTCVAVPSNIEAGPGSHARTQVGHLGGTVLTEEHVPGWGGGRRGKGQQRPGSRRYPGRSLMGKKTSCPSAFNEKFIGKMEEKIDIFWFNKRSVSRKEAKKKFPSYTHHGGIREGGGVVEYRKFPNFHLHPLRRFLTSGQESQRSSGRHLRGGNSWEIDSTSMHFDQEQILAIGVMWAAFANPWPILPHPEETVVEQKNMASASTLQCTLRLEITDPRQMIRGTQSGWTAKLKPGDCISEGKRKRRETLGKPTVYNKLLVCPSFHPANPVAKKNCAVVKTCWDVGIYQKHTVFYRPP